jgi:hypothetical protein
VKKVTTLPNRVKRNEVMKIFYKKLQRILGSYLLHAALTGRNKYYKLPLY